MSEPIVSTFPGVNRQESYYSREEYRRDRACPGEVSKNARHWLRCLEDPATARRDAMAKMGILDNWINVEDARRECLIRLQELFDYLQEDDAVGEALEMLVPRCDLRGCEDVAEFEGWARTVDPLGQPTAMLRRAQVCLAHKHLLVGSEKE